MICVEMQLLQYETEQILPAAIGPVGTTDRDKLVRPEHDLGQTHQMLNTICSRSSNPPDNVKPDHPAAVP